MSERMPSFEDVSKEPQKFMSEGEIKASNTREELSNIEKEIPGDFQMVFEKMLEKVFEDVEASEYGKYANGLILYRTKFEPSEIQNKLKEIEDLIEGQGYELDKKLWHVKDKYGFIYALFQTGESGKGYMDWSCNRIGHDGSDKINEWSKAVGGSKLLGSSEEE
ncbi:MAG: hypothetical protein Q8M83_00360 [bacterium]|nr:hypothetical protein [bacterium]